MARRALVAAALASVLYGVAGSDFYSPDHFDYVKRLTVGTFDSEIRAAVDSGKTMQAPGWNSVTALFKDNEDVVFGDVNLAEESIVGAHNPGAGGWPTIRYFNKETGYAGASYQQKTGMSMCEELGPSEEYMQKYVEEAGKTSLCKASTGKGCSEREVKFAEKWKSRPKEDLAKETGRLSGMLQESMKKDLKDWITKRVAVLKQLHEEL